MDKIEIANLSEKFHLSPKCKKVKAFYWFNQGYMIKEVAYLVDIKYKTAWNYYQQWMEIGAGMVI